MSTQDKPSNGPLAQFSDLGVLAGLAGLAEDTAAFTKAAPTGIKTAADIGTLIRAYRKTHGFSQQSFADLSGVGRRFVSELENGKATLEFDKVARVAASAGIDLFAQPR